MLGREQHVEVQNGVTEEKRKPISYTDDTHSSILLSKRDKKELAFKKHCIQKSISNNNLRNFNEKAICACGHVGILIVFFHFRHSKPTWFNVDSMTLT